MLTSVACALFICARNAPSFSPSATNGWSRRYSSVETDGS
jgi:hypothetical protein